MTRSPMPQKSKALTIELMSHAIICILVVAVPFMLLRRDSYDDEWLFRFKEMTVMQIAFLAVFYINYLLLIPKLIFGGKVAWYVAANILLIGIAVTGMQTWHDANINTLLSLDNDFGRHAKPGPPKWFFWVRDLSTMILTIGVSIAISISKKWVQSENARKEAEKNRTEAELKNLRNQINPHFLLNTLNNIYALIVFDTTKAQNAVMELSRLLQHILYDNQEEFAPLPKEASFIKNYIELMKIRLPANVKLEANIDIDANSQTMIAPLIFISLIENSFKHGISPTKDSHIAISLNEDGKGLVTCKTCNSNFPKSRKDKSGSGIGLEQVQKRLELTYPGHYVWDRHIEGNDYISSLTVNTNNDKADMHNH